VGVLLIVGLIVGGFVALLGTFSVIARFGPGMQVKVSVIMIALSVISVAVGPLYDMLRHPRTHTPMTAAIYGDWGTGQDVSNEIAGRAPA